MSGHDCLSPGFVGDDSTPFCPACLREIAAAIGELPSIYVGLANRLIKTGGVGEEAHTSHNKPGSRPPIDLRVDEVMRRIVRTVGVWEIALREHLGLPGVATGKVRPGFRTARAVMLLTHQLDDLVAMPLMMISTGRADTGHVVFRDGVDAVLELKTLHRMATAVLGLNESVVRLPGDCPGCGALTLRRRDGGDEVWCDLCKRRWPYPEYQRYVSLMTTERLNSKTGDGVTTGDTRRLDEAE